MAQDEEKEVLVIKDNKKRIGIIIGIIVLLLVIVLVVFGIVNKDKFKYFGADMVLHSYASSYLKLDGKKYCNVMPEQIINKSYEGKDKCNEAMNKIFSNVKEKKQEFKNYEIKDKDEVSEEDFKLITMDLERNYDISSKDIKKIVRYSLSFSYKDNDTKNEVKVYVAKINNKWFVVDQKTV